MFGNKAEIKEKVKKVFTKIGKRNLIIILSLVLIGGAAYLNWRLFAGGHEDPHIASGEVAEGAENETVSHDIKDQNDDSFAAMQINRRRARDEAVEVFRLVADSSTALEESKAAALEGINRIAETIEKEANIESLITSKGFSDCIAVISDGKAEIAVRSNGLLPNEIAQIQEIVYEQAGIVPSDVKIIESAD